MNVQDDGCMTESSHRPRVHPPPGHSFARLLARRRPHPLRPRPPRTPPYHDGSGDKRHLLYLLLTRLTEFIVAHVEPVGAKELVVGEE